MTEDPEGLTVAEMSNATGVSPHTLRYYERVDLIRTVARNSGNQCRYSAADVKWVEFLLRLRETGMPIAQMRDYAALRERGIATAESRLHLLQVHQEELRQQISRLRAHEKALPEKITTYRNDLGAHQTHQQAGTDDDQHD